MKLVYYFLLFLVGCAVLGVIVALTSHKDTPEPITYQMPVERDHHVYKTESPYVGKVKARYDSVAIRLLILKHCPDDIADIDAGEAVQAVDVAKTKGLTIQTIGNYRVDKEGKTNRMAWGKKVSLDDLQGLKNFISEQMKVGAEPGDTIIVYTIGHGSGSGSLMRLGQREKLFRAIAEAAEENDQETFWWQLSCHAAARLPSIDTLNERQQELFAMSASSTASELSYFKTQGKIFSAVFDAMAAKSPELDQDEDEIITAGELSQFIGKRFSQKRGDLVFARSKDEPIFGYNGLANQIPIRDRNNPQGDYPKDYIPRPKR